MTVIMIVAGFLFCSVSAYMAGPRRLLEQSGLRHHDLHDPVCLLCCSCCSWARTAALGPVAAIMIGAVVCCAACIGGDNLQDLKAATWSARRRGGSR